MEIEPRNGKKRLLCIEDEAGQRVILDEFLRSFDANLDISWASDALQAFEHLKKAIATHGKPPFHLIITDVFLEGKITGVDFWEVCRSAYPEMPILVVSGLPREKLVDFSPVDLKSVRFLQKPLNMTEMGGLIRSALGGELSH